MTCARWVGAQRPTCALSSNDLLDTFLVGQMRGQHHLGNLQLAYMGAVVLWGMVVAVYPDRYIEISSLVLFALAGRGFRIEKELSPAVQDLVTRERQKNPRHIDYYHGELGYLFSVVMLIATIELIWVLQRRF